MTRTTQRLCLGLLGIVFLVACEPLQIKPAPKNVQELKAMGREERKQYPPNFIVQFNLVRVLNAELKPQERIDSLKVIEKINTDDKENLGNLSTLLRDKTCPQKLHREVLRYLLQKNYANLAPDIVPVLRDLQNDPELRTIVLRWLKNNPVPQMLAGVVRAWADESAITPQGEQAYREAVLEVSGKQWDVALLNAMNAADFSARGAALEILSARVDPKTLRARIMKLRPGNDAMVAIQSMLEAFDYLPGTREELVTTDILFKVRRDMLPDAARLSIDWSEAYGYRFNIRDFHILSRLARDPLRSNLKRMQLVLEVGQTLKTRKHVNHKAVAPGGDDDYKENFWLQVDDLTMTDLWNLYLLNEMLSRPRVQTSLRLMAKGDLKDTSSAWGGLVFYQNGQAEASLYPPSTRATGNDLDYVPSRRLVTDGRDSMCRFVGHFDKVENAERAGPTAEELADLKKWNYYSLILTRTGKDSFCAHYYNPEGKVVSLGEFPLR